MEMQAADNFKIFVALKNIEEMEENPENQK